MRPLALTVSPLNDIGRWSRSNLLIVVLLIIGCVLVTRLATWTGERITARIDAQANEPDALVRSDAMKHRHAVVQVVTWTVLVLVYCLTAALVVNLLGFPLSGFVAPATVVGVALGFGAQRIVQDLLAGFLIVIERQYGFGDVVHFSVLGTPGVTGTVEELTLRSTRIRSLDGEVITTPNGSIVQVTNLSRDWARSVIDVPVPVSVDVTRVTEALRRACDAAVADPELRPLMLDAPTVMGVETIEVDQFNVRVVARTLPGRQFEVGRALRARITRQLLRDGITVSPDIGVDKSAVQT